MTREEWAERIRALIEESEADGMDVWIDTSACCGCVRAMPIRVNNKTDDREDDGPIIGKY